MSTVEKEGKHEKKREKKKMSWVSGNAGVQLAKLSLSFSSFVSLLPFKDSDSKTCQLSFLVTAYTL